MDKEFLSTTEVAKLLGVSRVAVFKKIKSGKILARKVGRNFLIRRRDLGGILGTELTTNKKRFIEAAVRKTVREYGETLRLLGRE
ncbi:MAG: helix-turn-helix domain-containing protein [Parcubacteria group bacterium]|nr:helix-turn-helix domain-containing protein [Parcubacteria group bacterium]